jgi:hypothetical protein
MAFATVPYTVATIVLALTFLSTSRPGARRAISLMAIVVEAMQIWVSFAFSGLGHGVTLAYGVGAVILYGVGVDLAHMTLCCALYEGAIIGVWVAAQLGFQPVLRPGVASESGSLLVLVQTGLIMLLAYGGTVFVAPRVRAALERSGGSRLPEVGATFADRYRIDRLLGSGGMGRVYAATHLLVRRRVALKLPTFGAPRADVVSLMIREARAAARIEHPNVATVLDAAVEGEVPYIVIELLEGEDLAHHIDRLGKVPARIAADYALQAMEGVAAAHARGIVHRDLKPGNIFVSATADGPLIKVLDFGISKLRDDVITRSMSGGEALVGTPAYMAPEQLREPSKVDERSDVWAMGVILYELLCGRRPYAGSLIELIAELLHKAPTPIRMVDPSVDPALARVIERCLEKDVDRRYQDLAEVAHDLARAAGVGEDRARRVAATLARSRCVTFAAPPA